MAVAPPFANLLIGMTKLRTRKPKSHPVHRGQADFVDSGTSTVKSLLLAVLSRLDPVKIRSGQDYPSGPDRSTQSSSLQIVLRGRC
jgi:hypothetical protein